MSSHSPNRSFFPVVHGERQWSVVSDQLSGKDRRGGSVKGQESGVSGRGK